MSKILIEDKDILEITASYNSYPEARVILRGFGIDRGGFRGGKIPAFKPLVELPKKYIINKGATILFWEDGSKTVVKRDKDDEYNKVLGFLWAYFQKTSGLSRTKANKYLAGLVDEEPLDKEDNSIRKHKIGDVVTIRGCGDKRTITDYYDNGDSHGYFLDNGCIAWYDSEFED